MARIYMIVKRISEAREFVIAFPTLELATEAIAKFSRDGQVYELSVREVEL